MKLFPQMCWMALGCLGCVFLTFVCPQPPPECVLTVFHCRVARLSLIVLFAQEVLEDLVNLIGIPLPALLPSSDNDKICNEEDNSCGSIIARTADNYGETDTNGNHGTGDENTNFRNENTNINTWASNNNPEGTEKEKLNSLFCSLCRTPCYDTAAMEVHLAQHCEVQVE